MSDVLTAQVAVGFVDPTPLVASHPQGLTVLIRNRDGATSVYVGAGDVTDKTGVEVKAGEAFATGPLQLPPDTSLYAIGPSLATPPAPPRVDVFQVVAD